MEIERKPDQLVLTEEIVASLPREEVMRLFVMRSSDVWATMDEWDIIDQERDTLEKEILKRISY